MVVGLVRSNHALAVPAKRLAVLALAAFPVRMAATRFRVAAYLPHLVERGIDVDLVSWLDEATASRLYTSAGPIEKGRAASAGTFRQLKALARGYDVIWLQREAMMIGPPIVEALAMNLTRTPLVLDFDDAIWIADGGLMRRVAKCAWKTDWTIRRAAFILAGSNTLGAHAHALGAPSSVVPTVVEAEKWTPLPCRADGTRADHGAPPVIGWIGTHSTAPQLSLVVPALLRLRREGVSFRLRIVGAGTAGASLGLEAEYLPWRQQTEIDDFRALDVGLAPMFASPWHEGKCGFKQIQYMAVGVPQVSSLVGGARDFLRHRQNALVAHSPEDWYTHLRALLVDQALRRRLSLEGRALVEDSLSIERQVPAVEHALRTAASAGVPTRVSHSAQ